MRGQPKVKGAYEGDPVKLVRCPNTGAVLMKAGGGRMMLPGSADEIRVRDGRLWVYADGEPLARLGAASGGSGGSGSLPDGEDTHQPLTWNGVGWAPGKSLALPMGAIGRLVSNEVTLGEVVLAQDGIYLPGRRKLPWSAVEKLLKLDTDAPHGLPLAEVDGVLHCSVPLEAPNLKQFAWREEVERIDRKLAKLVPEVAAPPTGSISFDVTPDGSLAVTVKKQGRTYRGTVKLVEI